MRFRVQLINEKDFRAGSIPHNMVQTFQVAQNDQAKGLTIPMPGKTSITTDNLFR